MPVDSGIRQPNRIISSRHSLDTLGSTIITSEENSMFLVLARFVFIFGGTEAQMNTGQCFGGYVWMTEAEAIVSLLDRVSQTTASPQSSHPRPKKKHLAFAVELTEAKKPALMRRMLMRSGTRWVRPWVRGMPSNNLAGDADLVYTTGCGQPLRSSTSRSRVTRARIAQQVGWTRTCMVRREKERS
jgi:hypothetical protein